jgi:hypothetical protein
MKRLKLLFVGSFLTLTAFGQYKVIAPTDTIQPKKQCALVRGRALYIGLGVGSSTPPHPSYDFGGEIGFWGMSKPTTLALTFDAVRQDSLKKYSHWIGIKPYLTLFGTEQALFMVYIAPKIQTEDLKKVLLEIGINPVFNINKHVLFSFSVCNQVMKHSEWNFGGSIGLVIIK